MVLKGKSRLLGDLERKGLSCFYGRRWIITAHHCAYGALPGTLYYVRRRLFRRGFPLQAQVRREAEEGDAKAQKLIKLLNWQKAAVTPLQAGQLLFGALGFAFCLYSLRCRWRGCFRPGKREPPQAAGHFDFDGGLSAGVLPVGDLLPKKGARNNALALPPGWRGRCAPCTPWPSPF